MWRASDLVECLIFVGLALMLVHTVFVVTRFFLRYSSGCREFRALLGESTVGSLAGRKALVADLSRGVRTLKAIAFAAPFLGLAGTYYGILCLFARGWIWSYGRFPIVMSAALVATAAGLIVAIPAAVFYNVLRLCLEKFENSRSSTLLEATPRSYGFAQTLPLRRRFSGMPAFALTGVPVLGILLLFGLLLGPRISTGLPVHLLRIGASEKDLAEHISSPIVVSVVGESPSGMSAVYVNSKETPWNELGNTLRNQLKVRPRWIVYVEGEDDASWQDVVNVIDVARGLHAEVVLLTVAPNMDSKHPGKLHLK